VRFFATLTRALIVAVALLALADLAVRATYPKLLRFNDSFSAAYLDRTVAPGEIDGRIALLGDSVLWGYRLQPAQAAGSLLRSGGIPLVNLAYEGGSPPNTYALARLLQLRGARPKAVVFNVNLKEFNPADSAYRTLYPAVEQIVWNDLSSADRSLLKRTRSDTVDARIDAFFDRVWALYGLRVDIRERLFGAVDASTALVNAQHVVSGEAQREAKAHRPTAERFMATYDLEPLDTSNTGVIFLRKTLDLLRAERIPVLVILTPTNHGLLKEFIDGPEYAANRAFVEKIALAGGAHVLDYDRAFVQAEFIDNDHLTADGNKKLADLLAPVLRKLR
jgi:hypothetical protein